MTVNQSTPEMNSGLLSIFLQAEKSKPRRITEECGMCREKHVSVKNVYNTCLNR